MSKSNDHNTVRTLRLLRLYKFRTRFIFISLGALIFNACAPETSVHTEPPTISKIEPSIKTELLVIGTSHLSSLGEDYKPELLDTVVERVQKYKPDMIAIEAPPGWTVATMLLRPNLNADALGSYVKRQAEFGSLAQAHLGKNWGAAQNTYEATHNECAANPTTDSCILNPLAAYDYYSAMLRWSYLSQKAQDAFRDRYPKIAKDFETNSKSANEYVSFALRLAVSLGHTRIFPVDDHLEKGLVAYTFERMDDGLSPIYGFWGTLKEAPYLKTAQHKQNNALKANDLIEHFLWLNSPQTIRDDKNLQFTPLSNGAAGKHGIVWNAYWESRNLRMASHITDILADNAEKKMVFIVGSSHKGYIDRYFSQMDWVRSVDAVKVLSAQTSQNK